MQRSGFRMTRVLLVGVACVIPFLSIWQGLDFTDMGFAMANYQQIFHHPDSIRYWGFNYWLTDVLGGLWLVLFPHAYGILGIRAAASIVMVLTVLTVHRLLRQHLSPFALWSGLIFAELFIERMYWLNYDNLTGLFYTVAGYLLLRGVESRRITWFTAAGAVLGFNVFIRLTNITGIALAALVFVTGPLFHTPFRKQLQQLFAGACGFTAAAAVTVFTMHALGQYGLFLQTVEELLNVAGGHANTHSSTNLLRTLWADESLTLRVLLIHVCVLVVTMGAAVFARPFLGRAAGAVCALLGAVAAIGIDYRSMFDRYQAVVLVSAVLYGFLVAGYFQHRKSNPVLAAANAVALWVVWVTPLGSDLGIRVSVYGMYMAIPLVIHQAAQMSGLKLRLGSREPLSFRKRWLGLEQVDVRLLLLLPCIPLLYSTLWSAYHYTYRDTSARSQMVYGIQGEPLFYGVYTTRARAMVVQQLLDVLPQYVHPGDVLMAYEETSLVYYATDTRPYLDSSWPMLYEPDAFTAALRAAAVNHSELPVVVRATGATADFDWPNVNHLREDYRHNEDRGIMQRFLTLHGYHVVWHNSFFQILLPGSAHGATPEVQQ